MKKQVLSMLFIAGMLLTQATYGETWNIQEGPIGEWHGEWTIDGTKKNFSCSQRGPAVLTAKCMVIKDGDFVAVRKTQVSDNNPCNYFGRRQGNRITGTYFCRSGGPYSWSATVAD